MSITRIKYLPGHVLLLALSCNAYAESYATILKTKHMSTFEGDQNLQVGSEIFTGKNQNFVFKSGKENLVKVELISLEKGLLNIDHQSPRANPIYFLTTNFHYPHG